MAYQDILEGYFGGDPEAYAEAIQEKESAGIPLSHPEEAAAFKQDYPHLFGGASAASGGGSTSSGAGTSTFPIRSYFEGLGYKVEWQGHGKPIRVYNPETGHSANIMPENYSLVGGTAYAPEWVAGAVKGTIRGGKYTLPGYSDQSVRDAILRLTRDWAERPAYSERELRQLIRGLLAQQYQPPEVPRITWEEAFQRAQQFVEPEAELARQRTLARFLELRERLPYTLAARGQLRGGLRAGAEAALTQQEAMALNEIALMKEAQRAQLAQAIYENDQEAAEREMSRAFKEWYDSRLAQLATIGALTESTWREEQANASRAAQLMNWLWLMYQREDVSDDIKDGIASLLTTAADIMTATGVAPDAAQLVEVLTTGIEQLGL